jgi:adenosine deaminase
MNIKEFIRQMPKVELHVHLEGSIEPQTLLKLAERHNVTLPARNLDELHDWYKFTGFDHFIEVYLAISSCIRTADDLELIAAEFLKDRAEQNILYSEVIYTPYTHLPHIPLDEQLAALNRARKTAEEKWGCASILRLISHANVGLLKPVIRSRNGPSRTEIMA